MTIGRLIKVVFALLALLAIISALLIGWAAANRRALLRLQEKRLESRRLAGELRQSSDDLTRFARTYAVTADPRYERYYREVLAIRNGTHPRPHNYDLVYWDLRIARGTEPRPAGPPVSLRMLMERAGFTADELASLGRAQAVSDSLVRIEETAIHAVRGEYRDETGAFTRRGPPDRALAIRLMHDSVYHHEKARIMAPIDSFLETVTSRAESELAAFSQDTSRALLIFASIFGIFLVTVLLAYPVLRWKVLSPVGDLQRKTKKVAADLERLAEISTRIAGGDLAQSFEVRTALIRSSRRDEIGDLSRLHDSMVAQLQVTGAAIAKLTADMRAAKEAAESASRAKGAFVAHMSHEIRTPMNAILGYAQLLRADESLGPEQRRKLAAILSSGDHLLGLLNDVLDMSRIEAGRMALSAQPFHLPGLLDGVQSMFTELTSRRGLSFEMQTTPDLPRGLLSDPGKIRQVLINLLGNAIKFTDTGGVAMRVASRELGPKQLQVIVEIEDSGAGIPADHLEEIFTAFGQSETGRQRSGTGLGLTISRNVARLLGGDLTVRSTVGEGSTFTFTFVATRVPDADVPDALRARGSEQLDSSETRRKVLFVDDVPSNRELLEEALQRAGFETRSAVSGEEALKVFREWRCDLVLMDLHMPGMGGLAAIKFLRAEENPPVMVATTAGADDSTSAVVAAAGAVGLLRKPYRENDLFETIGRAAGLKFVERPLIVTEPVPAHRQQQDLGVLARETPAELIAELKEACRQARAPRLLQLADRVAEHSVAAAEIIRDLANGFRYRALLDALQGAHDDKA